MTSTLDHFVGNTPLARSPDSWRDLNHLASSKATIPLVGNDSWRCR
jgi:hypothetical protein